MSRNSAPERRHVIDINIGADSEEELLDHLTQILYTFRKRGISKSSVIVSYSTGHTAAYRVVNEDVTHESWWRAVKAYMGKDE